MSTKEKPTPMMIQYLEMKAQYPDAFLFFRLGDFYELFNDDAVKASRILEITLTSRNKSADNPIPMCGVPHHSAKDYIRRLVEAGHKVAICEQVEDPKLTKGMVKREVVEVITPGTYFQDEALVGKDGQFIATIQESQGIYYLAYMDVTTGQVWITHSQDKGAIINQVKGLDPKEIVLEMGLKVGWIEDLEGQVSTYYSRHQEGKSLTMAPWQLKDANENEEKVLNFLFDYLFTIQKKINDYVQPVERYEIHHFLQMNHFTKQQLELSRALRTQRKKGSLLWLLDQTKTAMGSRMLQKWLDQPLLSKADLLQRHDRVARLMASYFERMELMDYLDKVYDLERLVTKISMATAGPRDIDQLRNSLRQLPYMNEIIGQIDPKADYFETFMTFTDLLETIDRSLNDNPPYSATDGEVIRAGYHQELDQYRDAMVNGNQWLAELQSRERELTGLKTLKIGYNKVFGYYIEISRLQASQLQDDRYERKQTLANNERFVTQELKDLEVTILSAKEKGLSLEYALFVELRKSILPFIPDLQALAAKVAELDVLVNFANISEKEGFIRPQISDQTGDFEIQQSRHPVLEKLIGTAAFVPNDIKIEPQNNIQLLTGPNMSGKSTYMRQVAYCVILNQIGCYLPAQSARLPIIDKIFTRIGSSDDLSSGQSTFMVEMMETQIALSQATPQSLLLFDELGRGTATYDGMALAHAIIHHIADQIGATTIFSTHYHELTDLDRQIPTLSNIHVGAVERDGKVVFLHKIIQGSADKSYGIHVAHLAGLPDTLIAVANQRLIELENGDHHKGLASLSQEQTKGDLQEEQEISAYRDIMKNIKDLDINRLTPLEALQVLSKLQNSINK